MLVLDALPIIYLAKLRLLERMEEIDKFCLVGSVFREVTKTGDTEGKYIRSFTEKRIKNPKKDMFSGIPGLSKADSESISLAKELSCTAIIDEKGGREVAEASSVENHGTVYLLFQMLEKRIITKKEFKGLLDRLVLHGFYLSSYMYSEVLKKLEKS